MNCVVNNRGSMVDCMMNRGSVMDTVSTESCERSSWPRMASRRRLQDSNRPT